MAGKFMFVLLLGTAVGLPERYGHAEPPPVSSYTLPKPAASGPEARALTVPQPLPYRFEYEVAAPETGDQKSASESRSEDGVVRGEYSYVDPTGSLRTVRYTASDLTGFVVEQEVVPGFAEPPPVRSELTPAAAAPQQRTAAPETEGERETEEEVERKRQKEAKRKMVEEQEMKREEEAKKKKEEEQKRKEEEKKQMEEEAEKIRDQVAEKKRKEEEKKREEEEKMKKEMEEAERQKQEAERKREYEAAKKREQEAALQAARERERRRRLFGLAPPQLLLPAPLLVESPTLTLLRTRVARPPPVPGVRIRGRGINIAY